MNPAPDAFLAPTPVERLFNRVFGFFVGLGFAPRYIYLLQVPGRKTGRLYSTPVNILGLQGQRYLVAPRGQTQWVRNAQSAPCITLKRGRSTQQFRLRPIPDPEKPAILKAYLGAYSAAVQRYFPIPASSPLESFAPLAPRYPVFELFPL